MCLAKQRIHFGKLKGRPIQNVNSSQANNLPDFSVFTIKNVVVCPQGEIQIIVQETVQAQAAILLEWFAQTQKKVQAGQAPHPSLGKGI